MIDLGGLLATLYGGTASAAGTSSDPIGALTQAEANSTKDIAQTAAEPSVARDIATFTAKVTAATDPATLLKDPTVLKVLLTANGLGDQVAYTALAQKALLSDTTKTTALANQLTDTAWKSAASLYDFANKGLSVLQKPSVISTLANGYAEVLWRQSLDATTPGLSNALTFKDAGVHHHLSRSDPRRFHPAHRGHHGVGHPGADRLPGSGCAGERNQLAVGHHPVQGPEVRRQVHRPLFAGGEHRRRIQHDAHPGPTGSVVLGVGGVTTGYAGW